MTCCYLVTSDTDHIGRVFLALCQRTGDHHAQVAANLRSVRLGYIQPKTQLEVERTVAKSGEEDLRFWLFLDQAMPFGYFGQYLDDAPRVLAVGHAHADGEPHFAVGISPIGKIILQQSAVGDESFGAIPQLQHRGAQTNAGHGPFLSAYIQHVTYAEWPFEKNDQAANEILEQSLHAKTQSNRQGAARKGEKR